MIQYQSYVPLDYYGLLNRSSEITPLGTLISCEYFLAACYIVILLIMHSGKVVHSYCDV